MKTLRPLLFSAAIAAIACAGFAHAKGKLHNDPTAGKKSRTLQQGNVGEYDYYLMALSWSPTFCETHPDEREQCAHQGYGFVLHGLWPQYEDGGGPERCVSDDGPSRKTVAETLAFMPSKGLIEHEWRAHGACTGLGPEKYFETADRAFAALKLPPELKAPKQSRQVTGDDLRTALKRANPALTDDMMTLHCSKGELVEVRVCLDKSLKPRDCGGKMRNACSATKPFSIPASN